MSLRLEEVKEILECEVVVGEDQLDLSVDLGCAADLMSDVLAFSQSGSLLLTGLANEQAVRTADIAEVKAIVFVRGKKPNSEAIKLAERRRIPLLCTKFYMYEAAGRLYASNLKSR